MKPKILIVDDKVENLVALERVLQDLDVEFCRATNGNDAIAQTLEQEFALILIDVQMPEMDGYETVEILREEKKNRHIPVIFMSAIYSDDYFKIKGIETGAVDFLSKPIISEILTGKVQFFIDYYLQRKLVEDTAEELSEKNRKLEESEKALKKLNKAKDQILSIIGHDLRGPLHGIIGYTDIILSVDENFTKEEVELYVNSIKRISIGLYNLLKNLLDWARIQTDDFNYKPENVSVLETAESVIEIFSGNLEHKEIKIECKIEESHNAYVDKNMLETIFRNFISNSIKFCSQGGSIKVLSRKTSDLIELDIIDDGIGLAEEEIYGILNSDQIKSTCGTNQELGTGLGLSLCKELIKTNHGALSISSIPNQQTIFRIQLPTTENNISYRM